MTHGKSHEMEGVDRGFLGTLKPNLFENDERRKYLNWKSSIETLSDIFFFQPPPLLR